MRQTLARPTTLRPSLLLRRQGHEHVSKISLTHVTKVYIQQQDPKSFVVATAGGAYVLTAGSEAEAKSWKRSVEVSCKVAKAASK